MEPVPTGVDGVLDPQLKIMSFKSNGGNRMSGRFGYTDVEALLR
jgi:hypothetical protein